MKKDLNSKRRPSGSTKKNEPKVIGEVLNEYLASNEPLAVAYRNRLFKDIHPHTELGVDLKLLTREPGRMPVGTMIDGAIVHDDEVHRKDDGTLYPTFNRPQFTEYFTFQDFCREAAEELIVVAGLIEKNRIVGK